VAETEVTLINKQLRDSISSAGSHEYFSILNQNGKQPLDISVEVPTAHDSKSKGWYRIESGQIIPQKILFYGPGFAFMVIPWTLGAGLLTSLSFIFITRKLRLFRLKK